VLISNQWFVFKEAITVWGSPQLAAQLWHRERPGSLRALQAHAADLRMKGDIRGIVKLVDGAPFDLLNRADFQVFKLKIYCQLMPEDAISKMLPEVVVALKTDAISAAAARELININDLGKEKKCAGLAEQTYLEMLNLVASASDRAGGGARSFAHDELANYWINCRVIDKAMYHLEQAQRLQPSLNLVAKMVTVLTSAGLVDQAQAVLRDSRNQMPMRPFVYDAWEKVFDQLEATLDRASAQQSIYARPQ